ncbi:MAG: hypothetical protein LBH89_02970 [Lactococcus lactis]|jgi:hypothetical protein|nr:hypothetical protein [Lactococcus lactis]
MLTEAQREVVPKSSFSEETMNKAHELVLKAITDAADGYERLFRVCKNCHQEYQLGEFEENNYMCYYDDCFSEHGEEEDNLIIDEFGIDWG